MIFLIPIAVVVALLAAWLALTFNAFVRSRNITREAWSGIDVQLKRRHDLVPALAEVVGAYAAHEKQVQEECARIRAGVATVDEPRQVSGLRRLLAIAEQYPNLKADQRFGDLHRSLVQVEDELQLARRYYNGAVRDYNTRLESFPNLLLAPWFGFKPAAFFQVDYATERQAPDLDFGGRGGA